jgi:hypothetical protein|tara:strand:- start:34 stop:438 length:405 start_codon:yes stop_codon:yes gene_type:complete
MNLNELEILEDDFDLFVALNDHEKIEFLFDALEEGIEASVMKQVSNLTKHMPDQPPIVSVEDYQVGPHRLCVTVTKTEVHLNSNSLKAIRRFVSKMINDGLLLWPSSSKKSVFDIYRYFKSYRLIARVSPLSSN